jgi:chromatin remodeling complex protein RSC6
MVAKGKKGTTKAKKSVSAKKGTVKRKSKVVEKEQVEEPVKVLEETVEETVEEPLKVLEESSHVEQHGSSTPDVVSTQLSTLLDTVSVLMSQLKSVQGDIKTLQKNYGKVLKEHAKTTSKSKRQNRKPSGFAKPSALSAEMTGFLGLDKDIEMPRNEVTKLINKYIVDNELRDNSDKRKILPDKKLGKLLGWDGKEQVSYFNLQKYIKQHFVKNEVSA